MKVLVTGGAGFIGSWVAEFFSKSGWEVLAVDDFSHGKKSNLPSGIEWVNQDILAPSFLQTVLDFSPDVISHHAAQVKVLSSWEDPISDARKNIEGTLKVLLAAQKARVKRVILASSVAVYGEPQRLPVSEEHPLNPSSPYGLSKLTA